MTRMGNGEELLYLGHALACAVDLLLSSLERWVLVGHVALSLKLRLQHSQQHGTVSYEIDDGWSFVSLVLPADQVQQCASVIESFQRLGIQDRAQPAALVVCLADVLSCHAEPGV